jgi:hypothetical protein
MKTHTIKAELPDLPKAGEGMKWAEVEYRNPQDGELYHSGVSWITSCFDYEHSWHLTTRQIPMTQSEFDEAKKLEIDPNDDVIRVGDTVERLFKYDFPDAKMRIGSRHIVKSNRLGSLMFEGIGVYFCESKFRKITPAYELEKLEDKRLNLIEKCKKTEGKLSAINSRINILRKAQS